MKKDTIYRADAIEAVEMAIVNNESIHKTLLALPSVDVVSREEYNKLFDDSVLELQKLEKEYDDVIAQLNQKLENSVSREFCEKVLIECGKVKTKLGELEQATKTVQGEWVRCEREMKDLEGNILCYVYWYECDQCRSRPPRKQFEKQEWLSDFCPNCGAKMKGADDETN